MVKKIFLTLLIHDNVRIHVVNSLFQCYPRDNKKNKFILQIYLAYLVSNILYFKGGWWESLNNEIELFCCEKEKNVRCVPKRYPRDKITFFLKKKCL